MLPAGAYRVVTDEELIEGISFSSLSPSCDDDLRAGAARRIIDRDGDH
jgi:hypothetical protein